MVAVLVMAEAVIRLVEVLRVAECLFYLIT